MSLFLLHGSYVPPVPQWPTLTQSHPGEGFWDMAGSAGEIIWFASDCSEWASSRAVLIVVFFSLLLVLNWEVHARSAWMTSPFTSPDCSSPVLPFHLNFPDSGWVYNHQFSFEFSCLWRLGCIEVLFSLTKQHPFLSLCYWKHWFPCSYWKKKKRINFLLKQ